MTQPASEDQTSIHVRRAVDGDNGSLGWIVAHFSPALHAQARFRLRALAPGLYDPEDLVQDAWAVALPRLHELSPREGRYTPVVLRFLSTALLNRSNTLLQKHLLGKPLREIEGSGLEELSAQTTQVVSHAIRSEASERLHQVLEELSDQDREVIVLRGIEQNSNQVAALLLGLRPNTVAARYRRALIRLRQRLPGSIFDELDD